jgi:hypothetical protein
MTAIILEFPGSQRSHRTRGVCFHCLGRYPDLTDYSCYGFGKWTAASPSSESWCKDL